MNYFQLALDMSRAQAATVATKPRRSYPTCYDCFMNHRRECIHPQIFYCRLCETETTTPDNFSVESRNADYQVGTCEACK